MLRDGEQYHGEVIDTPHYELIADPSLLGFSHVEVVGTKLLASGHAVPSVVDVHFPDGDVMNGIPADWPAFILRPTHAVHGVDIVVSIERAHHIKYLHIDGLDSGSVFLEGTTLESLLMDVCAKLPAEASEENYSQIALGLDMGEPYGWENLSSFEELVDEGVISLEDYAALQEHRKGIIEANRTADIGGKRAFVDNFNRRTNPRGFFLKVIREPQGGVIIPHVVGEPHLTSNVLIALSTRYGEFQKKVHTMAPGRMMGAHSKHPIPGEHFDPKLGRVNMSTFHSAAWKWSGHALIVPNRDK